MGIGFYEDKEPDTLRILLTLNTNTHYLITIAAIRALVVDSRYE
jgi:hypothetical protein